MFGFIKFLYNEYKMRKAIEKIEQKKYEMMKALEDNKLCNGSGAEWARLCHEERKLKDGAYAKMSEEVERLNKAKKSSNKYKS